MVANHKKRTTLKGRVLTVLVSIIGVIYWMIGKAENVIESLNQE